jgi:hypothetical protein
VLVPGLTDVVAIDVAEHQGGGTAVDSCALEDDRTVWCWNDGAAPYEVVLQ